MPEKVNIPVEVTGADEAKKQLGDLGEAVASTGGKSANQAKEVKDETSAFGALKTSLEEVVKEKGNLADVVNLLGARFGPLLGDLGGVVELLLKFSPAAAAAALALGGLSILTKLIGDARKELEDAEQAVRRLKRARDEYTQGEGGAFDAISEQLQQAGALSEESAAGAYGLFVRAESLGTPREAAIDLAGVAYTAGLSAEDLQRLATIGAAPKNAEEARKQVERLKADPQALAEVDQQAAAIAKSRVGAQAKLDAQIVQQQMDTNPRYLEQVAGRTRDAVLFERGRALKLLGDNATIEDVDKLLMEGGELEGLRDMRSPSEWASHVKAKRLEALQPLLDAARALDAAGVHDTTGPFQLADPYVPGDRPAKEYRAWKKSMEHAPAGAADEGAAAGYSRSTQTTINHIVNIDSHYGPLPETTRVDPDRREFGYGPRP